MIRAKAVIGACVVCALAMSAIGVPSASAVVKGTTGFTCKEKKEAGGAGFSNADCTTAVGSGAKFEHVAIPENVKTEGRVTNTNLAGEHPLGKLLTSVAGLVVELQATEVVSEATGMNTKNAEGEHYAEGVGKTTFSGVTVTRPAGKGCKVSGGVLTTKELKGTSLGQGMEGKLEPVEGTTFMEVTMEGCSNPGLNTTFAVTGSIKCPGEGAIVTCTHAATTAQGTLKFGGSKAGIEVTTTATGRANSTEPFTPLAVTTIET
jgi:hypothetical protein